MPNNLPNPIPAGTVVFVPSAQPRVPKKGEYYRDGDEMCLVVIKDWAVDEPEIVYTRHDIPTPVHILSDEMVYAVQRYFYERDNGAVMHHHISALRAAFAHVLIPPQETGKEVPKTLVERAMALRSPDGSLNPTVRWNDSVLLDALSVIDAKIAALEAELADLRAKVPQATQSDRECAEKCGEAIYRKMNTLKPPVGGWGHHEQALLPAILCCDYVSNVHFLRCLSDSIEQFIAAHVHAQVSRAVEKVTVAMGAEQDALRAQLETLNADNLTMAKIVEEQAITNGRLRAQLETAVGLLREFNDTWMSEAPLNDVADSIRAFLAERPQNEAEGATIPTAEGENES